MERARPGRMNKQPAGKAVMQGFRSEGQHWQIGAAPAVGDLPSNISSSHV
jgi:hypothetical protein